MAGLPNDTNLANLDRLQFVVPKIPQPLTLQKFPLLHHGDSFPEAFPWLLNNSEQLDPWLPLDVPRDILYDGARVAALLDIRQIIGARSEPQERLTHILMDHDLHPGARQGAELTANALRQ